MHTSMASRHLLHATLAAHGLALLLAASVVGCGDDGGGAGGGETEPPAAGRCYEDPLSCPKGTVCSFDDPDGKAMSCREPGSGNKGDACDNVEGKAECGEGLVCLRL